jgi:hypothetical protein
LLELLLDLVAILQVSAFDLGNASFFLGHAPLVPIDVSRKIVLLGSALSCLHFALDVNLSLKLRFHFCALLSNSCLTLIYVALLVSHIFHDNFVPLGFSHSHALVLSHSHQFSVNITARVRFTHGDASTCLAEGVALLRAGAQSI